MAKVAREKQVTPRRDVSSPNRVPLSKLLLPAAMSNTVAFSGIHSVGILKDAEDTPETITVNIFWESTLGGVLTGCRFLNHHCCF
jgi:hypothetical protein